MHTILVNDLISAARDAQSISHAMSLALRQMTIAAPEGQRPQLTILAAAAELASDKAMLIAESVTDIA